MDTQRKIDSGKNLRRIRRELGLKQSEIVGEEVTRNLISMIENDRLTIRPKIAKIVSDNINRICRERGSEVYIAPEDIMYPERMEDRRQANEYVNHLKKQIADKNYKLDPSYVEKVIDFLNQWKMPDKKVDVYELLGELSYLNGDLEWEYLYLNKALENYFLVPVKRDVHVIGKNLIANCVDSGRYEEAFTLMRLEIMNKDDIPKKDMAVIYYNKALIYKKLGDYDKALELLNKYEEFLKVNNEKMFRMSLIVKAICYNATGESEKALDTYNKIISFFDNDVEELALAYSNMAVVLRKKDSLEEVVEYRDKVLDSLVNLEKINSKYLVDIYSRLGEAHEYLNNTNQQDKILLSNNIFKRGFENAELSNEVKLAFSLVLTNMETGNEKIASSILKDILKEANKNEN